MVKFNPSFQFTVTMLKFGNAFDKTVLSLSQNVAKLPKLGCKFEAKLKNVFSLCFHTQQILFDIGFNFDNHCDNGSVDKGNIQKLR